MNPLDQLADINVPSEISIWPLAWGYWVSIVLLVIVLMWLVVHILKRRKFTLAKRQALAALTKLDKQSPYYAHHVQVLLKQLCHQYIPNQVSAPLYGKQWQNLILAVYVGKDQASLDTALSYIFQNMYAPLGAGHEQNQTQIESAVTDWINTSLPPTRAMLLQLTQNLNARQDAKQNTEQAESLSALHTSSASSVGLKNV